MVTVLTKGRLRDVYVLCIFNTGARGGIVVKALRYKPAGRGFHFRWCNWNFSVVKCCKVLQCSNGTSNKVSNIIKRHIDNSELFLTCILLLSHSLIFFRLIFYHYMVVFRFKTVIYVFLL